MPVLSLMLAIQTLTFAPLGGALALVRRPLTPIGGTLAFIGHPLPLVCEPLTLVREVLAPTSRRLARLQAATALGGILLIGMQSEVFV